MRSYNRPDYLQETINGIKLSDIIKLPKKIIYDDNSTNKKTLDILEKNKDNFEIIYNKTNYKQKSFVNFMDIILNRLDTNIKYKDINYICYLDNDAIVKNNIIEKCYDIFNLIRTENNMNSNKIILTGFDTKKHSIIKSYKYYKEKKSIGGIHMFFHKSLLKDIRNLWNLNEDWGIVDNFKKQYGKLFSINPGIIKHIGIYGTNSNGINFYDKELFKNISLFFIFVIYFYIIIKYK